MELKTFCCTKKVKPTSVDNHKSQVMVPTHPPTRRSFLPHAPKAMASSLDDLMYDFEALLSPSSPWAESAAEEERDPAWVAAHCGACFEADESFVHDCKLKAVLPDHVVPLHAALVCHPFTSA